jgi:hypothetical protein
LVILLGVLALVSAAIAARALRTRQAGVCGGPRWPVKTLSDAGAEKVDYVPKTISVRDLVRLPAPTVGFRTPRISGVETTTYRIRVRLTKVDYSASDRDLNGFIADPGNPGETMEIEFPDTHCPPASRSIKRRQMARARARFAAACGSDERLVSVTAIVSGVGFFDVPPRRPEQPPNSIELHPVLEFVPLTKCKRGRFVD